MTRYGELIKACRKVRNMTQTELAKVTYNTQAQISSYECGRIIPRMDVFENLIEACGYELGIREKKDAYTAEDVVKIMERSR